MAFMVISNHFAKGFSNKASWTAFNWWKTSFNMPVRNIFDNNSIYTETEWMLNAIDEATSFDLSWFEAWWEIIAASTVFTLYWPFAWWLINVSQTWKNTLWWTMFTNSMNVNFPALTSAQWSSAQSASNQWVASWEVNVDWTYQLVAAASWAYSDSATFNVYFSNVPSVATYTPGMIWVEWNNLRWSSANWHLHTMIGLAVASPSATPGMIWVEWDYIMWIWSDWNKYRWQFNFRQFASAFSNGPSPTVVSWQTPWYVWMDSNFWYEHIWYIAADGYKWINPSWINPYI